MILNKKQHSKVRNDSLYMQPVVTYKSLADYRFYFESFNFGVKKGLTLFSHIVGTRNCFEKKKLITNARFLAGIHSRFEFFYVQSTNWYMC